MTDLLLWLGLAFLMPFLGIVAGAHYERWLRNRKRMPTVMEKHDPRYWLEP